MMDVPIAVDEQMTGRILLAAFAFAPLVVGFVLGRWWWVAVVALAYLAFPLGVSEGWWGTKSESWEYGATFEGLLCVLSALCGVGLRRLTRLVRERSEAAGRETAA